MDGPVEAIILCKDQQNDQGHVNVVRIPLFDVVQDLQDWHNLQGRTNVSISLVFRSLR